MLFSDAANSIDSADQVPDPYFTRPIENITVPIGKEAVLSCYVENLGNYKVSLIQDFLYLRQGLQQ